MPGLVSQVDTTSDIYLNNHEVQSAAVAALNEQMAVAAAGGGEDGKHFYEEVHAWLARWLK